MTLIDKVDGYNIVYKWFDYLKAQGHFINAFVIMPNHVHAVISFTETEQSINNIIGNGKRFMAYDIIKRLKENNDVELLNLLADAVETKRRANNKKHEVWELSFDWKHCSKDKFVQQKMDYIHINPCKGKWSLCVMPEQYQHSSAKYYLTGEQGLYKVDNVAEMLDKVLVQEKNTIIIDATSGKAETLLRSKVIIIQCEING